MENSEEYFERIAPHWDEMQKGFFSDRVREKALSVADVQSGRLAADVGAGTGFVTEGLLGAGLSVIAVDRSEAMLSAMRDKFAHYSNLECRVGESENLPVGDDEMDYVFANMYLHHTESPLGAILEMVRILKPEGTIVITDLDRHDFEFLREEQSDVWLGFDRSEIHRMMEETGLREVSVAGIEEDCCTSSLTSRVGAAITIFVASGRK